MGPRWLAALVLVCGLLALGCDTGVLASDAGHDAATAPVDSGPPPCQRGACIDRCLADWCAAPCEGYSTCAECRFWNRDGCADGCPVCE